jgi:uncharacterized protein YndB with AHSA1/START domain
LSVTSSSTDTEALTMTFVAEFDAPVERIWQVWEDPRQLERWWGPPQWPATFEQHDLAVGGRSTYFMTGPDGGRSGGWWQITNLAAPNRLEFTDGFSGEDGEPNLDMPVSTAVVTLESRGDGGTVMTLTTTFASLEQLEELTAMGMVEGLTAALGQIDAMLAETR